jgi:hypothetical protein
LIQHTISTTFNSLKIYFNEIYLFQNSPVQPLALPLLPSCHRTVAALPLHCRRCAATATKLPLLLPPRCHHCQAVTTKLPPPHCRCGCCRRGRTAAKLPPLQPSCPPPPSCCRCHHAAMLPPPPPSCLPQLSCHCRRRAAVLLPPPPSCPPPQSCPLPPSCHQAAR